MERKEEIKIELKRIDQEIIKLQAKKLSLETEFSKLPNATFKEKFVAWIDSGKGEMSKWMIDSKTNPVIRKFSDEHFDLSRHETIVLEELLEEDFEWIFRMTDEEKAIGAEWAPSEERIVEITKVCEEMMKTNLLGFTCDW